MKKTGLLILLLLTWLAFAGAGGAEGHESGTYSLAWTGAAYSNGVMVDVRGLTECTITDAAYQGGNTATSSNLAATPPATVLGPNTFNIYALGSNGNFAPSPAATEINNTATASAFGWGLGTPAASVYASSNAYFAIAGALLH